MAPPEPSIRRLRREHFPLSGSISEPRETRMAVKPKVLVVGEISTDSKDYEQFSEEFNVIHYPRTITRQEFISKLDGEFADIVAIFTVWGAFWGNFGGFRGDDLLAKIPDTLKVITITSVGTEQFDVKALNQKGVWVCNVPGLSAVPVAEIALHLTLSVYRYTSVFEHALRESGDAFASRQAVAVLDKETGLPGSKDRKYTEFALGEAVGPCYVHSPVGFRAGVAGFGSIGKQIGQRLNDIGMEVHYSKRTPVSDNELNALNYTPKYHSSVQELMKNCDLLVLALPLSEETRHIVNADTIKLLPKGAKVVNVGRGALVDQKALVESLKTGHLSAAGLDVYEHEPAVEPELTSRYDVTLLPHLGGATIEVMEKAFLQCMDNIRAANDGKQPYTPV
uniref:ARAD1D00484p n=1 Tax=Blastobotrys adeninivorans TaxID=409370 RepID=A0A060TDI1_BLAAD